MKKILLNKKGSLLWELMLVLFILFCFLHTAVSFLGIFSHYDSLTLAAKTAARQIEITGCCDTATITANLTSMTGDPNLKYPTNPIQSFSVDTSGVNYGSMDSESQTQLISLLNSQSKLQRGTKFKLTVRATYEWYIIGGADQEHLLSSKPIQIPLSYTVNGMAEHFWRLQRDDSGNITGIQ